MRKRKRVQQENYNTCKNKEAIAAVTCSSNTALTPDKMFDKERYLEEEC